MKLLIATTNLGKIAEYDSILNDLGAAIIGLRDWAPKLEVEESGATFEENARIKAQACAEASGLLTLTDDSGLCVDALGGAPGVYSARYAATERARIDRVLSELRDVPDDRRAARFVCVIALAEPGGPIHTFEGVCRGRIGWEPKGSNGFGYDPIFVLPEYGQTMAELPTALKNRISHRGRAALKAKEWLANHAQASRP